MVLWLYTLGIRLYAGLVKLAAFRSEKARLWSRGRADWRTNISKVNLDQCYWFHCASVGEFEQARPVIEGLRSQYPDRKFLLTFFSPSGYELRKHYDQVDHVAYLPIDTTHNMKDWLDLVNPGMLVLTKYDFWFNLMNEAHERGIPMHVISVHLQTGHWLFKWPGNLVLPRLSQFETIYAQDEGTKQRLAERGISKVKVLGDTRVDRVLMNASEPLDRPELRDFAHRASVLVAGSVWPADSAMLMEAQSKLASWKWIVAVHEPDDDIKRAWQQRFGDRFYHWKERDQSLDGADAASVIYIDFVGLLSKIYRFGNVAYVGGGFGSGIHNTLEPAAYHMPVLFGPKHKRFVEAGALIRQGAGFEAGNAAEFVSILQSLNDEKLKTVAAQAQAYFDEAKGASQSIVKDLSDS